MANSKEITASITHIDETRLPQKVEFHTQQERRVVKAARPTREGWAEAARLMRERGDDRLLIKPPSTRFDREEWEWC